MRSAIQQSSVSSRNRLLKLTMLWLVIVAAIGGVATAAFLNGHHSVDAYTLCKRSVLKAAATTAIIVDATDAFTEDQKRRLQSTVEAERERGPPPLKWSDFWYETTRRTDHAEQTTQA